MDKLAFMLLTMVFTTNCFVPNTILNSLMAFVDEKTRLDFGQVSESLSHEEILKRGLTKSVAQYLSDQNKAKHPITLDNMTRYYENINNLFYDYFGEKCFNLPLKLIALPELEANVARVDLDPETKNLPSAHFDANKFAQSNERVLQMTNEVLLQIKRGQFSTARKTAGQVLHTIQDFYSHSNWVEMGNTNEINTHIGTAGFTESMPIASGREPNMCNQNCKLVPVSNGAMLSLFLVKFNPKFNLENKLNYYKCENNINENNKLVSGYYTDQETSNGKPVSKPDNKMACSHGGILDSDSYVIPAKGGINKDSGFFLISPHARMHLTAAELAISHTEYFFNQIRAKVGDPLFDRWLYIRKDSICA